ncbi:TPA: EAL domain-containing protein [Stenotrophomonas maltophilia]|nr:EAL domain-containing protein [Stenotrophomonas maltophilia]HDS1024080.1 EAL domain-containing protein [Stenotrophomonas maltophilia]HDS1028425.1 EAL domain-containing protein [Stenotrophomonas maltophilia]HDS1032843.1 EAL domain-containing protein [Stenotrophomonas maltophilia]
MPNRAARRWQGLPKFHEAPRRRKIRTILSLAGVSCIFLGLAWTLCYLYFDRAELAAPFVGVMIIGVVAALSSRRADGTSLLIVAHGVFVSVCAIAIIDAPIAWVPRSAHLFLLPLAAGAAFTFDARERYGSLAFPLACLAAFAAFAIGALDFLAPGTSPPLEVRVWGARTNTTLSMMLLAAIFAIYRVDIGNRLRLERELGRAVRSGEIEVHYQPQVRGSGEITGVEALARWRRPSGQLLAPDAFIAQAEESGAIRDIGLEVLRQACELLAHWSSRPETRELRVAVNISPIQLLDPGFVAAVTAVIQDSQVDPRLIELELTESALSAETAATIEKMKALESLGLTWALDDFGTGFSGLSTLRTLPVRKLKIDRNFVDAATSQERAQRLLGKIVEISQVMGMSALAEGVETTAQWELLVGLGCDHFQGYLFARPMPRAALEHWLATRYTPGRA